MGISVQVVFDCARPAALAEFWKQALDYRSDDPPAEFATWADALQAWELPADWDEANAIIDPAGTGPRLWFQRVPEGKVIKNRLHLDVNIGRGIKDPDERWSVVQAHVDRLVGAGAAVVDERQDSNSRWVVMADPEGNEFCVQ